MKDKLLSEWLKKNKYTNVPNLAVPKDFHFDSDGESMSSLDVPFQVKSRYRHCISFFIFTLFGYIFLYGMGFGLMYLTVYYVDDEYKLIPWIVYHVWVAIVAFFFFAFAYGNNTIVPWLERLNNAPRWKEATSIPPFRNERWPLPFVTVPTWTDIIDFLINKVPVIVYRLVETTLLFWWAGGFNPKQWQRLKLIRFLTDREFGAFFHYTDMSTPLEIAPEDSIPPNIRFEAHPDTVWYRWNWFLGKELLFDNLPGSYITATDTLFKLEPDKKLMPVQIVIDGLTVRPEHGHAWKLAKLHAQCNFNYFFFLWSHIRYHATYDVIIASYKKLIPHNTVLRKLMRPHFRYGMSFAMFGVSKTTSVFRHVPGSPVPPYVTHYSANLNLMSNSLNEYKIDILPHRINTKSINVAFPFGQTMIKYFEPIQAFVGKVVPHIEKDSHLRAWIETMSKYLDLIYSVDEYMTRDDILRDLLASIIFNIAFHHHFQHFNISHTRIFPGMTLALPAPKTLIVQDFTEADVVKPWNLYQSLAFSSSLSDYGSFSMLSLPGPRIGNDLLVVDYKFKGDQLKKYQVEFREDLLRTATDVNSQMGTLVPLEKIQSCLS
jgi:hypothetical protein